VQAQGVKTSFADWMVMGSEGWDRTPEQIKSYAYQAAQLTGWHDMALRNAVCAAFPHIDHDMANYTLQLLKEYAVEYPAFYDEAKR